MSLPEKTALILGANSDVAKELIVKYIERGYHVVAASRDLVSLKKFFEERKVNTQKITFTYFDATDFDSHKLFYENLPSKPHLVVYAAGYLKQNQEALLDWEGAFQMMLVHYCGAVSILNLVATDRTNHNLERIIGLSSLSGVRGRKSNFIYGSTKSGFTQYLAGLRQYLFSRGVTVNVVIAGYIRSKMTAGLDLPESLMLEPEFIATAVASAGSSFTIVPGVKWKLIYHVLRLMPERLVAKLP